MIFHGGTDAGPPPRVDLSTNANPYGPSPAALGAMAADIRAYPDPSYQATRQAIGAHADIDPAEIVVGAGATELIYRLIQVIGGPVGVPCPGFGEYAHAARLHGQRLVNLPAHPDDGPYNLSGLSCAFITQPGSPDGRIRDLAWCQALQAQADAVGCVLIWDLAYYPMRLDQPGHPMCWRHDDLGPNHVALHAPNKAHGCTGLRAGWLRAPLPLARALREAQMSWILSAPGAAFLANQMTPEGDAWILAHLGVLHESRTQLAAHLTSLDIPILYGQTPWLMAGCADERFLAFLREHFGVKVRPLTSQGLSKWIRLAAPAKRDIDLVCEAFSAAHRPTLPDKG